MGAAFAAVGILLALGSCQFDASGQPAGDGAPSRGDGAAPGDSGAQDALRDAAACGAEIGIILTVDGVAEPLGAGEPFAHVLVGDTVTLSAVGSCSIAGPLSYDWQISPIDGTRDTALPDTTSATITVYPMSVQSYQVTVAIADDEGRTAELEVFAFQAHGWTNISGITNVSDIDVGEGMLWIAHAGGADRLPLADPTAFIDIGAEIDAGSDPPLETSLHRVYFGPADLVWLSHDAARTGVWRLDYDQIPPRSTFHPFDSAFAGEPAIVNDIGGAGTGIAIATTKGMATAADNQTFGDPFVPPATTMHAVTAGGGQRWAGASRLYDLDAGGTSTDPFGGVPDSKIRHLAIDVANDELWVATLDIGIARVDNTTRATIATYNQVNTVPLTTNKLRQTAVETTGRFAGDAWVATDKGVARYKRDRDTWVLMGNGFGLNGNNDVRSVAVDEADGRRAIYAGTSNGVVYIRAP